MQTDLEKVPTEIGETMLDQLPFSTARELILSSKSLKTKYENYLTLGTELINHFATLKSFEELAPMGYPLADFYFEFNQSVKNSVEYRYIRNKIETLNKDQITQLILNLYHQQPIIGWNLENYVRREFFASFSLRELECAIYVLPNKNIEGYVSLEYDENNCDIESPYFKTLSKFREKYPLIYSK